MSFAPERPEIVSPLPTPVHGLPGYGKAKWRRHIPNFGHLTLFLLITAGAVVVTQLFAVGIAMGLHLFPHESPEDLSHDPRLILPTMFLGYLLAGVFSIVIFSNIWKMPFAEGVSWDFAPLRKRLWLLPLVGAVLSIAVQSLSSFLPIPKELPIDQFFKTPMDVWLVAFFGVFIAPVFEELAFRGFLLPALANTWDTIADRRRAKAGRGDAEGTVYAPPEIEQPIEAFHPHRDPAWSMPALIFATVITSICFALLHADQLAHAYAPLAVLFCVSVVLCFIRVRWKSLAASALVHACYNGTIFLMLFIATDGFRHLDKMKQ